MSRCGLFLDRDGTLIVDIGYPREPDRVQLVDGAAEALVELQKRYALVVISNQSGVGRGLITKAEAAAVHERFIEMFRSAGVTFAGCYYCPHAPHESCHCRKPAPQMLLDAARDLDLDLTSSVMIGDKASDVEAGLAAGCARVVRFGADGDTNAATWPQVVELLRD